MVLYDLGEAVIVTPQFLTILALKLNALLGLINVQSPTAISKIETKATIFSVYHFFRYCKNLIPSRIKSITAAV